MRRSVETKLLGWKNDKYRKPLLITGARQVGKTYLIKDIFGPQNFKKMVYIDFRENKQIRKFVKNHPNAKNIIDFLSLNFETEIDKDTLLFFDEIQEAVQILTAAKYFCQDFPEIPVIMTGSLVRVKLKQLESDENGNVKFDNEINPENQDGHNNFFYPVGKIDQIDMYPMTFDEFILECRPTLYSLIEKSIVEGVKLETEVHELALDAFYTYLQVGGMPEAVKIYSETKSILRCQQTIQRIYNDYLADMGLYQLSSSTIVRSRMIFDSIYDQLGKENKNFKISEIEKGKRFRDYLTPFDWLELARLIYKSNMIKEHVTLPLSNQNDSLFRVYLPDCGLFTYQSRINLSTFMTSLKNNTLSGVFMENYVAIELRSRDIPLFFWKGKTSSEFEFILDINGEAIPLDAKKSRGNLGSLETYKTLNHYSGCLKVSTNNYGIDEINEITTMPFYALPFYLEKLKKDGKIQTLSL